jgi:hypothetical protein
MEKFDLQDLRLVTWNLGLRTVTILAEISKERIESAA